MTPIKSILALARATEELFSKYQAIYNEELFSKYRAIYNSDVPIDEIKAACEAWRFALGKFNIAMDPQTAIELCERLERMEAALKEAPCPRPYNADPDDITAGKCNEIGHCGCVYRAVLQEKP